MKILVSDFDNTFYTSDYKNNIKLVKEFVKEGNMFILATGRNLAKLLEDIKDYNIPVSYYITSDGALIYDKNYNILSITSLPDKTASEIFEIVKEKPFLNNVLIDKEGKTLNYFELPVNTILANPTDFFKASKFLNSIKTKYNDIKGYLSTNWLVITSIYSDKAQGLLRLIEIAKLNKDDVYTIGDQTNDIEMNKTFTSFAVSDSTPELKEVSTYEVKNFKEAINKLKNIKNY